MSETEFKLLRLELPKDEKTLLFFHKLYDDEYKFHRPESEYAVLTGFLEKHADLYHCLVLFKGDVPVGYMRLYERISTSSCDIVLMLDIVYVAPGHRGMGVGKQLVAELVKYASKIDAARIDLLADIGNEAAIKIYRDFDFKGRTRFQMHRFLKEQEELVSYFEKKVADEAEGKKEQGK